MNMDMSSSDLEYIASLLNLTVKICCFAFHTQTKLVVGAALHISCPLGGEAASWLLLSPDFCLNWTCNVFLFFKGSLFLCHGSC